METKSGQTAQSQKAADEPKVDYDHRTTVNLMAVIAVMLLAAGLYWTVGLINERQKLERCVGQGRRDCFAVPDTTRQFVPVQR